MKHDKLCMNRADPNMKVCHLCVLIRKVRAEEYEVGFRAGYVKGRDISDHQATSKDFRGRK
jgi:hypothetical protein